jgi:hypothetical protein
MCRSSSTTARWNNDWAVAQALADTLSPDQLHRTLDRLPRRAEQASDRCCVVYASAPDDEPFRRDAASVGSAALPLHGAQPSHQRNALAGIAVVATRQFCALSSIEDRCF